MKRVDNKKRTDRREFLKGAAVAGGAVAVAGAAPGAVANTFAEAGSADTPVTKGYHETAHIRDYYATTRR